ncbi:endonuclease MutS2 [Gaiella sp.]|uniref:endonuclease MutS2 n=1 Tax=Gaiella sp. TaxID=2663207 RepID=UPI00398323DC
MREHDLELLELPAMLARLGAATASEPGAALVAALRPSPDADVVRLRQQQTSEAISLIEDSLEPDLGGATDVSEVAELAGRGSALDTRTLMHVGRTIQAGVTARRALADRVGIPALMDIVAGIDTSLLSIADEIGRAVEEDGSDLRDSASPELRRLRRLLREGRGKLAERLRKIARDPDLAEYLQDDFVTERGGRPVLALRASARGRVPGIVHDSSGSGQTLFVEPFAAVDDSNRLREAEIAEREEVTRILRNLSSLVGAQARALADLVAATARLDLALACGSVSRSWRGAVVTAGPGVVLRGARHPLLDQEAAIPIDLELGDLRALVISGPNTGGKTVALKTLGLAAVLHQCGLRPPATEAALPIFDAILADIGDEQSIVMSLSTFSAHVRNLVGILENATRSSLVLLDEIAAGTDPVEGAALAEALLGALAAQARLTVTTSHYAELKEWASATDGAANAATGLDPETHEPLYTVALGRPGTSHALQTAERLGLDSAIVAAARGRVAPERLQVAELVAEAEAAAREAQGELTAAAAERDEAGAARAKAQRAAEALQGEIEQVRSSAAAERQRALAHAEAELTDVRTELEELRAEIRAARKLERERGRATTPAAQTKEAERDRKLGAAADRAARASRSLSRLDEPLALTAPLAVGDPVVAADLGVRGTIAEIVGDGATVLGRGGLRVRVPVHRLLPDRHAELTGDPAGPAVTVRAMIQNDLPDEIDLRGRTAQEAREAVRDLIDQAALAGRAEIRVIHGRGTGAVRKAVRDELAKHPLVDEQVSDSADGATVVRLGGPSTSA